MKKANDAPSLAVNVSELQSADGLCTVNATKAAHRGFHDGQRRAHFDGFSLTKASFRLGISSASTLGICLVTRFSHQTLFKAFRALRDVDDARDVHGFRSLVPEILMRLFDCDRANYNDFHVVPESRDIVPEPIPVWWPRYKDLYLAHLEDHPLLRPTPLVKVCESVTFPDRFTDRVWAHSPLQHEYFGPLGVRDQLSTLVQRSEGHYVGIAVNRARGRYSEADKDLLNLISPIIASRLRFLHSLDAGGKKSSASVRTAATAALPLLTSREHEVLKWIAGGKRNSEIACILGISSRTVDKHVENVLEKLGLETRTAAAAVYLSDVEGLSARSCE